MVQFCTPENEWALETINLCIRHPQTNLQLPLPNLDYPFTSFCDLHLTQNVKGDGPTRLAVLC